MTFMKSESIHAVSLDFDGCMFHTAYNNSDAKNVIESNRCFLNALREDNALYRKNTVFIGSNRQSKRTDDGNFKHNNGSCFPAIVEIKDYLQATLDPFLLADIYGDLELGKSFERAMDKNYNGKHAGWLFDESKVTLLYAQIHRVAQENPHEPIIFDFYDDRNEDILLWLTVFYSVHPELIPTNVTLRLNHYEGAEHSLLSQIQGNGFIDNNYRQTVKNMANQAIILQPGASLHTKLNVAQYVQPGLLPARVPYTAPVLLTPPVPTSSSNILDVFTEVCAQATRMPVSSQEASVSSIDKPKKRARELCEEGVLNDTQRHLRRQANTDAIMNRLSARFFSPADSADLLKKAKEPISHLPGSTL